MTANYIKSQMLIKQLMPKNDFCEKVAISLHFIYLPYALEQIRLRRRKQEYYRVRRQLAFGQEYAGYWGYLQTKHIYEDDL